jgi:hypothetical protein
MALPAAETVEVISIGYLDANGEPASIDRGESA